MATLTPFRYPGAKNRLLPILMPYLDKMLAGQEHFCDAFVGGGSVLLAVAEKYPTVKLYANDKDRLISTFWRYVADANSEQLNDLLALIDQKPTLELFYRLKEETPTTDLDAAYHALFFNRTSFSGLGVNPIGGKEQKSKWGVDCRYNAKKLKEKLVKVNRLLAGRLKVENKDFTDYDVLTKADYPVYLDPPYFLKGQELYREFMEANEHEILAGLLNKRPNWILSYDDAVEIRELYKRHEIVDLAVRYSVNGKKSSWAKKNELLIVRKDA